MKYKVFFNRRAKLSIQQIYIYLEKESSATGAAKVRDALIAFCNGLSEYPRRFPRAETVVSHSPEVRVGIRWNWKIYYRIEDDTVTILDIVHSKQAMRGFPAD